MCQNGTNLAFHQAVALGPKEEVNMKRSNYKIWIRSAAVIAVTGSFMSAASARADIFSDMRALVEGIEKDAIDKAAKIKKEDAGFFQLSREVIYNPMCKPYLDEKDALDKELNAISAQALQKEAEKAVASDPAVAAFEKGTEEYAKMLASKIRIKPQDLSARITLHLGTEIDLTDKNYRGKSKLEAIRGLDLRAIHDDQKEVAGHLREILTGDQASIATLIAGDSRKIAGSLNAQFTGIQEQRGPYTDMGMLSIDGTQVNLGFDEALLVPIVTLTKKISTPYGEVQMRRVLKPTQKDVLAKTHLSSPGSDQLKLNTEPALATAKKAASEKKQTTLAAHFDKELMEGCDHSEIRYAETGEKLSVSPEAVSALRKPLVSAETSSMRARAAIVPSEEIKALPSNVLTVRGGSETSTSGTMDPYMDAKINTP